MKLNIKYHVSVALLLLLGCFLMSSSVSAQYWRRRGGLQGDNYHFGYVTGSLGWGNVLENVPVLHSKGGASGSVGAGYEFRNSGLWVSAGAQYTMHRSTVFVENYVDVLDGKDTQDENAHFHYSVNQTDEMKWNFLDVPVMVGYYVHGFYIGAGAKVRYALNSSAVNATGDYDLSATYDRFGDKVFHDIPEQGYTKYDFSTKQPIHLKLSASLIGELGYDLLSTVGMRSSMCHVLKLGVYFEYGLSNMVDFVDKDTHLVVNPADATQATISPYFTSAMTVENFSGLKKLHVVPFYTGVKLTYMLGGSRTARGGFHRGCQCYN